MSRIRLAIAHFADADAAAAVRKALLARGASAIDLMADAETNGPGACRLEVPLPVETARRLLEVLLSSDATRVDVHDAE